MCVSECVCVSEVSEEEDGRGGGGGYRTKNKNPTRQCGENIPFSLLAQQTEQVSVKTTSTTIILRDPDKGSNHLRSIVRMSRITTADLHRLFARHSTFTLVPVLDRSAVCHRLR